MENRSHQSELLRRWNMSFKTMSKLLVYRVDEVSLRIAEVFVYLTSSWHSGINVEDSVEHMMCGESKMDQSDVDGLSKCTPPCHIPTSQISRPLLTDNFLSPYKLP